MDRIVASSTFDCVSREGEPFVAELLIGEAVTYELENGQVDFRLAVSFEPLFAKRSVCGVDSFQAICLAIELIRDALRAFDVHGGRVYFPSTHSPIDLESPSFAPINEPIDRRFLS